MCCEGECLFCIPVRTGSLIFGYIIAVISALGTIGCTGVDMYFSIRTMFPDYSRENNYQFMFTTSAIIITTGYLVEFLSSFICSVLLLVGITKNKPKLVKTFLIYGLVQVVLLFVFFIMVLCVTYFFRAGVLFLALAFLGIYVMCLYMVFKSYQLMVNTNDNGHVFMNPPVNTGNATNPLTEQALSTATKMN